MWAVSAATACITRHVTPFPGCVFISGVSYETHRPASSSSVRVDADAGSNLKNSGYNETTKAGNFERSYTLEMCTFDRYPTTS